MFHVKHSSDLLQESQPTLETLYEWECACPPEQRNHFRGIWPTWSSKEKEQAARPDKRLEREQRPNLDSYCPKREHVDGFVELWPRQQFLVSGRLHGGLLQPECSDGLTKER